MLLIDYICVKFYVAIFRFSACTQQWAGGGGARAGAGAGTVCYDDDDDDDSSLGNNLGANKNYTLPYKQARRGGSRRQAAGVGAN